MHKSATSLLLSMVSYFKYKKHCQPLSFWLPVSPKLVHSPIISR